MDLTSGFPLWLQNTTPASYPKLESDCEADVVIIGAGISGALVAHSLVHAGMDCIILDARTPGLGSTVASTALLQYELDLSLTELSSKIGNEKARHIYSLCSKAIDKIEAISAEIEFDGFERAGSLFFADKKRHAKFLRQEFESREAAGFDVSFLEPEEIKNKFGFESAAAIESRQGACLDAFGFTQQLLAFNFKKGLRIYEQTCVTETIYFPDHVILETKNGFRIKAKTIVNACGYEAMAQIGKSIASIYSSFVLASEPMQELPWKNRLMLWNTGDPYLYLRVTKDNRVIVGGRDEPVYNPELRDRLLKKKAKQLTKDVLKLFPGSDFVPEFCWAGTFAETKDSLPYIGYHKKFPRTLFALGYSGNGIPFSAIAADIITDLITGKINNDAMLFAFDR